MKAFCLPRVYHFSTVLLCLHLLFGGAALCEGPVPEIEVAPVELGSLDDTACLLGWGFCDPSGQPLDLDQSEPVSSSNPASLGLQLATGSNLNISFTGQAGGRTGVVGLGRSAEETDIRSLGISLNPPQGGGFDLASFPVTFWGSLNGAGIAQGGNDVRASTTVVELLPWSAAQLLQSPGKTSRLRLLGMASTLGVLESSVAWVNPQRTQSLLGVQSLGAAEGAAASWSGVARWGAWHADAHLLYSQLMVESPGSSSFPTPGANQGSFRLIPVVGVKRSVAVLGDFSLRAYVDWGGLDYEAPSLGYSSEDQSQRLGVVARVNSASRDSEFGLSIEEARLQQSDGSLSPAPEWTIQSWAKRSWGDVDRLSVEPSFGGIFVSGLKEKGGPQGALTLRRRIVQRGDVESFAQLSSKLRVPSLLNRFYESPFFVGNPALESERIWALRLGLDSSYPFGITGFYEFRENALITTGVFTPSNSGRAWLVGVESRFGTSFLEGVLEADLDLRWTASRVTATGDSFPLVPEWSSTTGVHLNGRGYRISLLGRGVSSFSSGLNSVLPGFALWAIQWEGRGPEKQSGFNPKVLARIENLFERQAAWIPDYPLPGRTFSIALSAELD